MAEKKVNRYKQSVENSKATQERILQDTSVEDKPEVIAVESEPKGPAATSPNGSDMVGLNLRVTKERRALIKAWCALHGLAMNELFADVIDQINDGRYNPLD